MAMLEHFPATRADFSASLAGADFCGDSNIKWFVSRTGQSIHSYKHGAAAVVVAADWAIQYPVPMPPKLLASHS